ncbi:MAG: hypothetical protein HFJ58_01710 [Clostridia bacterium]|nr:hypothetical protein [Clostridia bacterium]
MNNNDKNINPKRAKLLVVFSGIALLITIILLIAFSFVKSKYSFEITTPIIILVTFLLVIFLSDSFDNFQIGKLISLKRNVTEYKEKNEKLENEKNDLIKQIINLNIQSQHTQNTTSNTIAFGAIQKGMLVEQANEEEVKKDRLQEYNETLKEATSVCKRIDRVKFANFAIKKYFGEINYNSILQDVKVNNKFGDTDPISNRNVIFDAYYNDNEKERFIEVKQYASVVFYDRLYVMLNKIYNYNNIKNAKANLILIIPKLTEDTDSRRTPLNDIERLKENFSPAIASRIAYYS